jgi:hypothetical protein
MRIGSGGANFGDFLKNLLKKDKNEKDTVSAHVSQFSIKVTPPGTLSSDELKKIFDDLKMEMKLKITRVKFSPAIYELTWTDLGSKFSEGPATLDELTSRLVKLGFTITVT